MCVDEIRDARLLPAAQSTARHPLPGRGLIVELDQLVRQQDTECFPIMRQPGPAFGFISQFGRQPPKFGVEKEQPGAEFDIGKMDTLIQQRTALDRCRNSSPGSAHADAASHGIHGPPART